MRKLSQQFLDDLKLSNGVLNPLYNKIKNDHTLMLCIRENYCNIYYRGGNILKLSELYNGKYQAYFDTKYNKLNYRMSDLPSTIIDKKQVDIWIDSIPILKEIMDTYFTQNYKLEREFQQLVARENNFSKISNESEYFISDIEFADSVYKLRIDMLALRWLASERQKGSNCKPAFIEMKYGDKALEGASGITKHLKDLDAFISDSEKYKSLLQTMESQFNQLVELDLLDFNQSKSGVNVSLNEKDKPEIIFIIANHNPRSTKLHSILSDPDLKVFQKQQKFDLKFFVANFSGYAMHSACMWSLDEFIQLINLCNGNKSSIS